MKRMLLAVAVSGFIGVSAMALGTRPASNSGSKANAADALPSVDQLLDKHVHVIGGKAAIEKLTSRSMKGW